jgi:hypothetical protein
MVGCWLDIHYLYNQLKLGAYKVGLNIHKGGLPSNLN